MSLQEKVARALLASESGNELAWDSLDLITRGAFLRDAQAAIAAVLDALRDCPPDVIDAGRDVGPDAPYGLVETREKWLAMLAEAGKQ